MDFNGTPKALRKASDESSQGSSLLVTRLREAGSDREVTDFQRRQQQHLQQSGFDSDITNLLSRDPDREMLSPIDEKKRKRNTQVRGAMPHRVKITTCAFSPHLGVKK